MTAKQFNVRLDEDLINKVRVECAKQVPHKKFQDLISELLIKWLEEQEGGKEE
jgi:hypothetical protein